MNFAVPEDYKVKKKKENEKRDRFLDFVGEQKKTTIEHEGNGDTSSNRRPRNDPRRFGKVTRKFRNQRTKTVHPGYSIVKIGQNAEKSPEDLRRLAVTQIPMKDHRLKIMLKTLKRVK